MYLVTLLPERPGGMGLELAGVRSALVHFAPVSWTEGPQGIDENMEKNRDWLRSGFGAPDCRRFFRSSQSEGYRQGSNRQSSTTKLGFGRERLG